MTKGKQEDFTFESKRYYNRGYYSYGNNNNSSWWREYVNRFNNTNPSRVLWTVVGLNIGVFVLWNTFGQAPQGRRFMYNNFTISWNNIKSGRLWTILTTNFSQKDFLHLLFNMLGLYFMGSTMLGVLGNAGFVYVYMMGGISSSMLHVIYENYIRPKLLEKDATSYRKRFIFRDTPALGASGSVMGLLVLFGLTFPREIIYLNFFIPVPAILLAGGYVAWDLWGAMIAPRDNVSHAGHLGGAIFALAYWASRNSRRFRRW